MPHLDSIFASLLKPLDRRSFRASAERHGSDAYCKSFDSWKHMLALIYAQLSGASSLRALEAGWNANAHHHYHLGGAALARSTLGDANKRRPPAVLLDAFAMLSGQLDRTSRAAGKDMVRLIDSTPVPLGLLCKFAAWNGRIRGLKMHLVYDPKADRPCTFEITPANVNDIEIGRTTKLEPGATYVFDKAYCHYGWWTSFKDAKAFFVTRPKSSAKWRIIKEHPLAEVRGDGFEVLSDRAVALASKGDSKLPIGLRLIEVRRDDGKPITVLTNDMKRPAVEIAALYKARWQIELFFRWIKQHLKIKSFLGKNENAIRLQIIAAMIAFALLRIAARLHRSTLQPLRFAQIVGASLFLRKPLAQVDKPPTVNPAKRQRSVSPDQWEFSYA
jgi:putative transposase